jgi:cytosine/adenosine deaminase-related metal-dependent hydrolase
VINAYHDPSPGAMTRIALAPCSPFSVTPDLMRESAMLARQHGVRLHTHIAETMDEDVYSRQEFGVSPIELLNTLGWLGDDVWVAHCVHPTDKDIGNMARTRTGVAHCPTSNMLLSSGLAPVRRFLQEGIPTGIGVDGSASNDANNLRAEVKQVVLASRIRDGVEAMPVRDALRIATRGSAECLGRDDIGIIEAGKVADLVLFDTDSLETAGGEEDLVAAIVLCDARPHTVMVHGNPIVELGALTKCDRADLARSQIHASRRLMERSRLH